MGGGARIKENRAAVCEIAQTLWLLLVTTRQMGVTFNTRTTVMLDQSVWFFTLHGRNRKAEGDPEQGRHTRKGVSV